jgi:hypothetical protein
MTQAGFEPAIPKVEWTQTQCLDGAATGTGMARLYDPVHPWNSDCVMKLNKKQVNLGKLVDDTCQYAMTATFHKCI